MSKNPKMAIAVALFATFIVGVGAGYILRGEIHSGSESVKAEERVMDESDNVHLDREVDSDRPSPARGENRWRPRDMSDREVSRSGYERMKNRMIRELNLNEEDAEAFFSVLRQHREYGRNRFQQRREEIQQEFEELKIELENDISEILDDEQMKIWREQFSFQRDRERSIEDEENR
ncbi:hypothetical protein QLX67_09345 [Balneolaceae bacterium ANBcel3]|nr:hypothetical protein [Balneolaceae bacterium ANBcel3]